jgi:hypothetical protein
MVTLILKCFTAHRAFGGKEKKIFSEICNKEGFIVFTVEGNFAFWSQILKLGQQYIAA